MARPKGKKTREWPLIRYRQSTPYRPWVVDGGMIDGKRVRHSFQTKEQAEGKAGLMRVQRKGEGDSAFALLRFDRVDAESALDLLRPHNVTLLTAAEFYVRNIAIIQHQKPVSEVVDELLKLKNQDGRSARYLKDLRLKLKGA